MPHSQAPFVCDHFMYLIQIFLPLSDEHDSRFPREHYESMERELVASFSGFTAYPRAPASGLWKGPSTEIQRDELVVYEVMSDQIDLQWWRNLRGRLEELFRQDRILIRSQQVDVM
jgi:hypothetical protein